MQLSIQNLHNLGHWEPGTLSIFQLQSPSSNLQLLFTFQFHNGKG